MPIHLYQEKNMEAVPGLNVDVWDLPTQLEHLEQWVRANRLSMTNGPYIADIGFMVRGDASGGGAVLSHATMKLFSEVELTIFFSEYVEGVE